MTQPHLRLKKGDRVQVLQGKDRGKQGIILKVLPRDGKVIVEGVNTVHRHTKARTATAPGGIVNKDMPIDVSSVAVLSPGDGRPTRVGYRFDDTGGGRVKVRVCKRTGADL
ncbi:MAG: 50S ribosomal protein L24 [Acidimicrobiales bacterium]